MGVRATINWVETRIVLHYCKLAIICVIHVCFMSRAFYHEFRWEAKCMHGMASQFPTAAAVLLRCRLSSFFGFVLTTLRLLPS